MNCLLPFEREHLIVARCTRCRANILVKRATGKARCLRCGICGWAMCGNKTNGVPTYRCDWRHRQGHTHAQCTQPSIVAYALHQPILRWLQTDVFTFERIRAARERVNALVSGNHHAGLERRAYLHDEIKRLTQSLARLGDAIERGASGDIADRYLARQRELGRAQEELRALEAQFAAGKIFVTDEALRVIADDMGALLEEFASAGAEELRALVGSTIKKAELSRDAFGASQLTLFYSPLPFLNNLATRAPYLMVGAKDLGKVGAPNGLPTSPKSHTLTEFLLDTTTIAIARPSRGRSAEQKLAQPNLRFPV